MIPPKKIKHFFFSGFVCLLFSCITTEFTSRYSTSIEQPVSTIEDGWLSNYFELDRIVPIETTDSFVMSEGIKRFIQYKNKLIFLDYFTASIYVADAYSGKIETYINRKGRGPGEWHRVMDISFDDQNEQILAYNDYQKLLYFSLDGTFIKEERVNNKLYGEIMYHDGNLIFYNHGVGISCYPYLIDIYHLADRTWKTIGSNQKVDFQGRKGCLMVKSKNIWYAPTLDMGLHILDMDSNVIKTPYRLEVKNPLTKNIQKMFIKSDYRSFHREVSQRGILYLLSSIRETEKYIVFNTNYGLMMLNKNSLEINGMWRMFDEYLGIYLSRYYPHDSDDNRIMFIVGSDDWFKRNPTAQNIPEHLKAQIEMVKVDEKIESNPILVFYKEKQ